MRFSYSFSFICYVSALSLSSASRTCLSICLCSCFCLACYSSSMRESSYFLCSSFLISSSLFAFRSTTGAVGDYSCLCLIYSMYCRFSFPREAVAASQFFLATSSLSFCCYNLLTFSFQTRNSLSKTVDLVLVDTPLVLSFYFSSSLRQRVIYCECFFSSMVSCLMRYSSSCFTFWHSLSSFYM